MTARKPPNYASARIDIYDVDVYLAGDKKQWRSVARRTKRDDMGSAPLSAGWTQFALWQTKGRGLDVPTLFLYVNVQELRSVSELVVTIAHEAMHAAAAIFDWIGHEPKDPATDEPPAYFGGWLSGWMWDHLKPMYDDTHDREGTQ